MNLLNKNKIFKYILFVIIIFFIIFTPNFTFSTDGTTTTISSEAEPFPLLIAIGMEAFITIHMSVFVLIPISRLFDPDKNYNLFLILFFLRVFYLLMFDLFITTYIAIFDFISVFIGAFILVPILSIIKKQNPNELYQESEDPRTKKDYQGISRAESHIDNSNFQYEKSIIPNLDIKENPSEIKANENCTKLKKYFIISDAILENLFKFVNENEKNTIIAEKNYLTLTGPNIAKEVIYITPRTQNDNTIIVTRNSFNMFENPLNSNKRNNSSSDEEDNDPIKNF